MSFIIEFSRGEVCEQLHFYVLNDVKIWTWGPHSVNGLEVGEMWEGTEDEANELIKSLGLFAGDAYVLPAPNFASQPSI